MAQTLVTKLLQLLRCWGTPGIQAVPNTGHLSSHREAHSSSQLCGHCQRQSDFIKGCTACKHEMQAARDASELLFLLCSHSAAPHPSLVLQLQGFTPEKRHRLHQQHRRARTLRQLKSWLIHTDKSLLKTRILHRLSPLWRLGVQYARFLIPALTLDIQR